MLYSITRFERKCNTVKGYLCIIADFFKKFENQKRYLEGYAADHGYGNCVHYTDDGWSGGNFERPAWKRLIADIEAGKVALVLAKEDCVKIELNQKALENRDFVM